MPGFVGLWVPEPPRARELSPWKSGGRRVAQGDAYHWLGRPSLPATTHPSRTWGPNLARSRAERVASLLSEASKKVPQPLPVHASFSVAQ